MKRENLALVLSVISIVLSSVFGLVTWLTSVYLAASEQTGGNACLHYSSWVADRVETDMSDDAIAKLTVLAVQAGGAHDAPGPPSELVQGTFSPCGLDTEAGAKNFAAWVRGRMAQGDQPR
jgi:hypothetical protein